MKKRMKTITTSLKTLTVLCLVYPAYCFAAEDDIDNTIVADSSGSALQLESMAVTAPVAEATLGGIDIKQLPMASTIINQNEIKRLKFVDPDELLNRIPGETLVRNLRIPNGAKSYTIPLIDGVALGSPLNGATQDFGTDVNSTLSYSF